MTAAPAKSTPTTTSGVSLLFSILFRIDGADFSLSENILRLLRPTVLKVFILLQVACDDHGFGLFRTGGSDWVVHHTALRRENLRLRQTCESFTVQLADSTGFVCAEVDQSTTVLGADGHGCPIRTRASQARMPSRVVPEPLPLQVSRVTSCACSSVVISLIQSQ